MLKSSVVSWLLAGSAVGLFLFQSSCLSVTAPREIHVGKSAGRQRVDTQQIPATTSHSEARQKLRESYARIDYLEDQIRELREDNRELEEEAEEYERKYEREKDRRD